MNFELKSIGLIHSPHRQAAGTPIQPRWAEAVEGTVEIFPDFARGLRDLAGFERIWLFYWFDQAPAAELEVVPFCDTRTHGIFATRAPNRPNPIGFSCVRLLAVQESLLHVAGLDVLDGTPLLDVKPYVPDFDVFAVERTGWYANNQDRVTADGRFSAGKPVCTRGGMTGITERREPR